MKSFNRTIRFCFTENLPPSELKKLRNKQRKAKKKAELESAQAAQAQVKKDQHNKSRQQNQDGDPEAPQLDELIPDKLARPDDPLEKAIDFLKPLQLLAKDCIETHLLAFEIYYRKNKLLLMLQSIKRARCIDDANARLHWCIIRFYTALYSAANKNINENVKLVLNKETANLFNGKDASELNQQVLTQHSGSFDHVLQVARCLYQLDSTTKEKAVHLVTSFDVSKLTFEVKHINTFHQMFHSIYIFDLSSLFFSLLQKASEAYEALTNGYFGSCDEQAVEYKNRCHQRFVHAILFKDAIPSTAV